MGAAGGPGARHRGDGRAGRALAREFGGTARAQVWAAVAVGGAGFVLGVGHMLSTATFDFAFWLALILVVARLLRTGEPRWWVLYGVVAGVALWNKHLVVLLTVAVLVALCIGRSLGPAGLAVAGCRRGRRTGDRRPDPGVAGGERVAAGRDGRCPVGPASAVRTAQPCCRCSW